MAERLADSYRGWVAAQSVFPLEYAADVESRVLAFYRAYLDSPFREKGGGSRFNNLLWIHLIVGDLRPSFIVDSGTYRGASAWAMGTAAPDTEVFSFDIDLSRLARRLPNVRYFEHDWTEFDFAGRDSGRALCMFDDHLDQARRLLEARDRGMPYLIFDDDFPVTGFTDMAHGGVAFPKIEFVLDDRLRDWSAIEWVDGTTARSWPIDQAYFSRAREAIAKADRLPNIASITGIHQTPFRLVATRLT